MKPLCHIFWWFPNYFLMFFFLYRNVFNFCDEQELCWLTEPKPFIGSGLLEFDEIDGKCLFIKATFIFVSTAFRHWSINTLEVRTNYVYVPFAIILDSVCKTWKVKIRKNANVKIYWINQSINHNDDISKRTHHLNHLIDACEHLSYFDASAHSLQIRQPFVRYSTRK